MLTNYIDPQERFIVCPSQDVVYGAGFIAFFTKEWRASEIELVPLSPQRRYVTALHLRTISSGDF